MFTGIIETASTVTKKQMTTGGMVMGISLPKKWKVRIGESITINGVCSTVKKLGKQIEFFYMPETLEKSNLGIVEVGDSVNLERSMRISDRLDGHIVQGHVDTKATVSSITPRGDSYVCVITLFPKDRSLLKFVAPKGSITLEGISLTVVDVTKTGFSVNCIPYTWEITNLYRKKTGDLINIEFDMMAKYVARLLGK